MNSNRPIVIFGGTGFVGRHLVAQLVADGHSIVVPSRNRSMQRELHVVPQARVVDANVHAEDELRDMLKGAQAAINLVGILNERGRDGRGFEAAHIGFTEKVIAACHASGTRRLLQMSALNAGRGKSHYLRTRGDAEARVKASGLDWTIFQPSVIFGPGDGLFQRFARLLQLAPVLPLARANAKFAPVYVGDVADAFVRALTQPVSIGQTFELYGPDVLTLQQIVRYTAQCMGLHRGVLPLPDALGRLQAALMDFVPGKPFSTDNFLSLQLDSVGGIDGLHRLGIEPTPMSAIIPTLLGPHPRQRRHNHFRRTRGT
jgi:uncharacterized protein YbjT (DUF2867 family)